MHTFDNFEEKKWTQFHKFGSARIVHHLWLQLTTNQSPWTQGAELLTSDDSRRPLGTEWRPIYGHI